MEELQHLWIKAHCKFLTTKSIDTNKGVGNICVVLGKIRAGQNVTQEEWDKLDKAVNDYL